MLQTLLTDTLISRLPFTQGQHALITDTINKNLKLVISSSQKVFFFAHPGAVTWRIGVFPAVTTDKARATAAKLAREAASMQGLVHSDGATPPTSGAIWTFAAVVEAYIAELPFRLHNKTWEKDQKFLRRYVLDPTFDRVLNKHVSDVTVMDVVMMIREIADRPAPAVARNCLMKIRHLFRWAMFPVRRLQFDLETNPTQDLAPWHLDLEPRATRRFLSDNKMGKLLFAVDQLPSAGDRVRMLCFLLTGMSLTELSWMRWSEVDLAKKIWMRPTQKGTSVEMPLSDAVTKALSQLRSDATPESERFVFGNSSARSTDLRGQKSKLLFIIKEFDRSALRWVDVRRTVHASLRRCGMQYPRGRATRPSAMESVRNALERHARNLDALRASRPSLSAF